LLGAPTVSLEGPVPVERWGPIGPRARSVASTFDGCGYLDLGFEYAGHRLDCMAGISVEAVIAAVDELRGEASEHSNQR
jgi:heptosyltransferase I